MITNIKTGFAYGIDIFLYITLIFIVLKIYKKTYTKNNYNKYPIKAVINMFILSCTIFICYNLLEYGFISLFIPNYTSTYKFNIIHIINGIIFAPIAEEFIFRGIVLNQLCKKNSFIVANIIQASIFALLHFDLYIFCFLFIFGVILGIVCKYINIYCCILIHSLNNLLVVLFVVYNLEFIELPRYGYLLVGSTFSLIILKILTYLKVKYQVNNR